MIRTPALRPVKLLTPNDAIPKWCLTGRYGAPHCSANSKKRSPERASSRPKPVPLAGLELVDAGFGFDHAAVELREGVCPRLRVA
jgi:hypothetical protein